MSWLTALFTDTQSPAHAALIYSLVIAAGMVLGRIRIRGVSLGVTFVLFTGLVASALGARVDPAVLAFIRDFGLVLFVFFIGLQVGPSFFNSFRTHNGRTLNLLTIGIILAGLFLTLLFAAVLPGLVSLPQMLGIHFGAVTNTPGLGAARDMLSELGYSGEDITIGYASAYPLGVIGAVLTVRFLRRLFRIDLAKEEAAWDATEGAKDKPVFFHVELTNKALSGRTIREIAEIIGKPFICSRILHDGTLLSPGADTVVEAGDTLRIVSNPDHRQTIIAFFGSEAEDFASDIEHSPVTSRIIRVTRPSVNGLQMADLHLSRLDGVNITRVFRSGLQLFPYHNLTLQLGDRVYCVGPENSVKRLAERLGDEEQKLNHPNMLSLFIGIALGILVGAVPITFPGMPVPVKLGVAGGPLVIAILLGSWGPRLRLITYMTPSANLMLREFGMVFFLASIGLAAGDGFAEWPRVSVRGARRSDHGGAGADRRDYRAPRLSPEFPFGRGPHRGRNDGYPGARLYRDAFREKHRGGRLLNGVPGLDVPSDSVGAARAALCLGCDRLRVRRPEDKMSAADGGTRRGAQFLPERRILFRLSLSASGDRAPRTA